MCATAGKGRVWHAAVIIRTYGCPMSALGRAGARFQRLCPLTLCPGSSGRCHLPHCCISRQLTSQAIWGTSIVIIMMSRCSHPRPAPPTRCGDGMWMKAF